MHLRQYEIVTDVDKLKVDLQATFMKYKTIKQWAYIVHDKDDTRPHYHIYVNFGTGVDSKLVAEWFKLGYTDENGVEHTGENFISKVKGRKADVLKYLTHENESQKYKHIYDRSEIVSNFNIAVEIEQSKIIGDFERYSYAQQLKYVESLPIDEKIKTFTRLKKLWELHLQTLTLNSDRSLEVVFICGKGGTGKTYYAKKMLENMGLDFCISSASNDPFQDYMGQNAIILDDLRYTTFELENLLKILDNDTSSTVKARFKNIVFPGKVIVITTPVPLWYWYPEKRNDVDSLTQLYRRIGTYVEVTESDIKVYKNGILPNGHPAGLPTTFENGLRKQKREEKEKTDFVSVFENIAVRQLQKVQLTLIDGDLPFDD